MKLWGLICKLLKADIIFQGCQGASGGAGKVKPLTIICLQRWETLFGYRCVCHRCFIIFVWLFGSRAKDSDKFCRMSLFCDREGNRLSVQIKRTKLAVKSGVSWERLLSDPDQVLLLQREGFSWPRTIHNLISHKFPFASQTMEVCRPPETLVDSAKKGRKKNEDRWAPSPTPRLGVELLPRS